MPTVALEELRQQVQMMYSCSMHPHVVRYYTSFVYGQSLWCVMKYLSGGSCSDIMKFGHPHGLDEHAIKIILKDTLKALEYFHANGRIHRDIKAGNIVISETGSVQVADFGVSGSLVEQLRTTLCGSPCWMAPEVMLRAWPQGREQSSGYDSAVDIWSLGITALELAKGRPPFSEFAPSRVFSMVVQNPPPALEDANRRKFSSSFKDFVSLCLQKDPSKRPSAAKLLKHKFFRNKKNKEYLVSTVLSQVPPLGERCVMDIPQSPPIMQSTGVNNNNNNSNNSNNEINWNFGDVKDSEEPLYGNSFESTNYLSTSATSQTGQSFGGTSILTDGSSYADSFFDDWFSAPTPANTMNAADFASESFEDLGISSKLASVTMESD